METTNVATQKDGDDFTALTHRHFSLNGSAEAAPVPAPALTTLDKSGSPMGASTGAGSSGGYWHWVLNNMNWSVVDMRCGAKYVR